jgi:5-methylcytosine-specific restriction endonuclease McrA
MTDTLSHEYVRVERMRRGANLTLGPAAKARAATEELRRIPSRRLGHHMVYLPPNEAPFVLRRKVDGRPARTKGAISQCEACGKDFFHRETGHGPWTNCSKKCGAIRMRRTKRAQSVRRGGPSKVQLDRWFSLIVRFVGVCQRCGARERLQCAHIVSRRYMGVRHAFDNAMCLCQGCHMFMTYRPLEWEVFVNERFGAETYSALKHRALDFVGPLDRAAVATRLFAEAERLGITLTSGAATVRGWAGTRTFRGLPPDVSAS